jgi:hypothetical protein
MHTRIARLAAPAALVMALLLVGPVSWAASATNFIANPGCEANTQGWDTYQATVTRVTSQHHSGVASCMVAYSGAGGAYTLDDYPDSVPNPPQGNQYLGSAWVRGSGAAVGKFVQIVLRQKGGSAPQLNVASGHLKLTTGWQQIQVSAKINARGRTALDMYVVQGTAVAGDLFYADDFSLAVSSTAPAPTATTVPSPTPTTVPGPPSGGTDLPKGLFFPPNNPWNTDISAAPVDSNSAALIASIGASAGLHPDFGTVWDGAPNGIPYVAVSGRQGRVPVSFGYADQSDPGPYPIPGNAPIEGGPNGTGDRHVLVVDTDNRVLYELYDAHPVNGGASWRAGSGAVFDLRSNALRPAGWTSADAAGLPILPGLVRYDEVALEGEITHALRFTANRTRHAYVPPATHCASGLSSSNVPPMGMRVRLKASFDTSSFSPRARVILRALQKYGMFLADNGSSWYISGAPDPRWNDDELATLSRVKGSDFEVVQMQGVVSNC